MGEALSLPGDTAERMIDILNNKFRCPSHKFKYTYEYSGGDETYGGVDIDTINYASYSASLGFHVYHNHSDSDGWEGDKIWDYDARLMLSISEGYVPKLNKIGNPAQKVYLMEGARYITAVSRNSYQISFNAFPRQIQGGNFMLYGPATPLPGDPFSAMLSCEEKQKYAYRHRNKMNVIFFDGHIEDMDVMTSTDVRFWLPSGTKIVTARRTNDRNACNGQVIK
jgi:prepilin-type processing-associated H-X9-DG protein